MDRSRPDPGAREVLDRLVATSTAVTLLGLRTATRWTARMLGTVEDPRVDAVRAEVMATLRRLLELPEGVVRPTAREPADDAADVRHHFQQLLHRSTDVRTVQGDAGLLEVVRQLVPDEARMLRHLALTGPAPAADVVLQSLTGRVQQVLHARVTFLAERAGAAEADRGAAYVRNLERLGLIVWEPVPVEATDDYQLIEGLPEVAASVREHRGDVRVRTRLRRGRLRLTALGERLIDLALDAPGGAPDETGGGG